MNLYLIGSLRNPAVPLLGERLRQAGFNVFDDWFAAGPEADDLWRDYEKGRGRTYADALMGYAARHTFEFDKLHLMAADVVVLIMPCGKSGFLELGWALGRKTPGFILVEPDVDRWDVMFQFATGVFHSEAALCEVLLAMKKGRYDGQHTHV